MTHAEQVTSFIANILLHDADLHAVTPYDMIINIGSWAEDGVLMPEDMTAQEAADTYNALLLSDLTGGC